MRVPRAKHAGVAATAAAPPAPLRRCLFLRDGCRGNRTGGDANCLEQTTPPTREFLLPVFDHLPSPSRPGQDLELVLRQQDDIAGRGLLLQEPESQSRAIDGVAVLTPGEAVPQSAPSIAIL